MKQSGDAGREMVFLNNATCPEQNSIYSLDTFHLREKGGAIYMTAGKWWEYLELSFSSRPANICTAKTCI